MYGYGGGLLWLVIIVVVGVAIYYQVTHSRKSRSSEGPAGEKALDLLKKRYARGEISKEEFENMKKDLQDRS